MGLLQETRMKNGQRKRAGRTDSIFCLPLFALGSDFFDSFSLFQISLGLGNSSISLGLGQRSFGLLRFYPTLMKLRLFMFFLRSVVSRMPIHAV